MTTTARRTSSRAAKPAPVEMMDETLAQFTAQIDAHVGRATGYADAVREWRTHSNMVAALASTADYRRAVDAKVQRFIDAGSAVVADKRLAVKTSGGGVKRALRSESVKAANPALWEASRPASKVVVVKHHLIVPPTLTVPPMRTAGEAWEVLTQARKRMTAAQHARDAARDIILDVLDEVSAVWDGTPRLTADGWAVGNTWRVQFNADRCARVAEKRGIDIDSLMVDVEVPVRRTFVLQGDDGGADEFDGE